MKLHSQIDAVSTSAKRNLYLPYEELIQISDDLCYKTVFDSQTNEQHHQITRPIAISINGFAPNGHMKNVVYTDGTPTTIELTNRTLTYRYNDFFQISYVLQGKIFYFINNTQVTAEEGGVLLIDDNTYYCEDTTLSTGSIINISIQTDVINEIFFNHKKANTLQGFLYRSFIREKGKQNMLYFFPGKKEENEIINTLISNILLEMQTLSCGYDYICKGYITRLLDHIASEYQYTYTKEEQTSFKKYLFNEIQLYMFRNYANMQIQDLVINFHYQRNYFNRLIKEFTGMTYSDYLIEIRISQAKHLLEISTQNIEDIMYSVGYVNKGFFYNNFHERIGMNPAEYRKTFLKTKTIPKCHMNI